MLTVESLNWTQVSSESGPEDQLLLFGFRIVEAGTSILMTTPFIEEHLVQVNVRIAIFLD